MPDTATFDLLSELERHGAIQRGHFLLASGRHSGVYFQCARLLAAPREAEAAGSMLAAQFAADRVESVIAPAIGGIVLSFVVARALEVPAYFAEKDGTRFILRRGFALRPGERVLVVEDVLTTGGSALRVVELVAALGATPVGIGALVNRGGFTAANLPTRTLLDLPSPNYPPEACPLCVKGQPLEKPGSR